MQQKTPDTTCIPLCRLHHNEYHLVGEREFVQVRHLNLPDIIAGLRARYALETNIKENNDVSGNP